MYPNDSVSQLTLPHVTIKAPAFSENSVIFFFKVFDAQFKFGRITSDETKYFHAISSIPMEYLEILPRDVIDSNNYENLKSALIAAYEQSKPELFEKLISSKSFSGRPSTNLQEFSGRPSTNLQELRTIASKVGVGDELVRHKFCNPYLPPYQLPWEPSQI
jgi:hypothetical protein